MVYCDIIKREVECRNKSASKCMKCVEWFERSLDVIGGSFTGRSPMEKKGRSSTKKKTVSFLTNLGSWLRYEGKVTGKALSSGYKKSDKDTKKLIIGCLCVGLGAVIPWGWLSDFGRYVQAGLIIGGALLLLEESGKGSKKKKKEGIIF